jgi:DNA gyrase subunit A
MATNIPPHNLGEIVDGLIMMIENPDVTVKELMKKIKGPDFPTGSIIHGKKGIIDAYHTGRGLVRMRAKVDIEEHKRGQSIIISELPYQVNKARLIEKIAELVRHKKVEGLSDLRDESDREGIRVVLEVKRGEIPQVILNQLTSCISIRPWNPLLALSCLQSSMVSQGFWILPESFLSFFSTDATSL